MNRLPVLAAAAVSAALCACASEGPPAEALRPNAVRFAQQQGTADLGCSAATAEVLVEQTIEEPVTTGGYTPPYRAEYTVRVSGCEKSTMYSVRCNRAKSCIARPVQAVAPPPRQLADELQPGAVKVAQERGAAEFECPAATAQVLRQNTIEEPVTTGMYTPPYQAEYAVSVSGCGKGATYSVTCDSQKKSCVARPMQAAAAPPRKFADELQPGAAKVAQQRGAAELECPAATAQVLRQNTIEEPVTTGMYTPPYRAEYTVSVSGCGKGATYSVTCDDHRNRCVTGTVQDKARE